MLIRCEFNMSLTSLCKCPIHDSNVMSDISELPQKGEERNAHLLVHHTKSTLKLPYRYCLFCIKGIHLFNKPQNTANEPIRLLRRSFSY